MPYCPRCHKEYGAGASVCEACGAELVGALPDESSSAETGENGVELVELATFPNFSEAEMIQELLESNGIQSVLRGEADPIGLASGATPSTLLVKQADLPSAHQIYEDYFAGEVEEPPAGDEEPDEEDGSVK